MQPAWPPSPRRSTCTSRSSLSTLRSLASSRRPPCFSSSPARCCRCFGSAGWCEVSFTWPLALLLVLAVPLVVGVYLLAMRRRRRQAVSYSSLALLRTALPRRSRWRRYLPVAMLLGSLGLLAIASARPQLTSDVPIGRTSIILALDVSRSMCSTDVQPNRLSVAQKAAHAFVASQPAGTRTGLVVFSGFAQLAVAPTTDRKALGNAI